MEQDILVYVGLDVHKEMIAISVEDAGRELDGQGRRR